MPVATTATRSADAHEAAKHAIEAKIAEIREGGMSVADSFDGHVFAVDGLKKIDEQTECGSVVVTDGPDGTREVSVLVLWRGPDDANRQVEVRTLVGR